MIKKTLPYILTVCFFIPIHGAKRMNGNNYPTPYYEFFFSKPVIFMFPMMRLNTIGVYYGFEEHEKITFVTLSGDKMDRDNFKGEGFDGYMTAVYPQVDPDQLTIAQKSSVGVLDFNLGKQIIDYRPKMPNYNIRNEYEAGKIINPSNQIVLSLFHPHITPENKSFFSYSLVLEDLKNGKVLKRLCVKEESLETIFLGKKYSYFLESTSDGKTIFDNWRAVDDNLEFIEHPLMPILTDQWKVFRSDAVLISESQECAVAYGALRSDKKGTQFFQITPWAENRPPVPVILPGNRKPSPYILRKTFLLSPSGKWLFFVAAPERGDDSYYLMYIDKTLPNYYLPPIEINVGGEDFSVTWMQDPEGFVVHDGKRLRYWDLSRFDPSQLLEKGK
ncbi:MAG: hypothetical protein JW913_17905 [Chitinispirillaceae bacterium]|nr:hypothetical protein [Chitinispirillaceae bacterium]